MTTYLDVEDLLAIVRRLGVGPVRDVGLLDAAAHRPLTRIAGFEPYADLAAKAAALLHSLVRNHALVDGNKRLGWAAATVFLLVNEVDVEMADDDAVDLVVRVAAGELDVDEIAGRIRDSVRGA